MTLTEGTRLGSYELQARLGAGGMGDVWRAYDTKLQRTVAIKVLTGGAADDAAGRVLREARAASALNHPHISTIYDVGEAVVSATLPHGAGGPDGVHPSPPIPYIVMEHVDGRPLADLVSGGGLPPETVVRYGLHIADALAAAHAHGIVHRDLKCANVVVTTDGRAKVLDFGVATRLSPPEADEVTRTIEACREGLNEPHIAGTLAYMAPELLRGERARPGATSGRSASFCSRWRAAGGRSTAPVQRK